MMLSTRLIFIEGMPGAGKSTTARWLAARLCAGGIQAQAVVESQKPHPLHAFWTWGDGYTADEVVTEPYEPQKFTARLLEKTRSFVGMVAASTQCNVVEAHPFQSPVRNHLKMGASIAETDSFYSAFQDAVAPAQPLLAFLEHRDLEATFARICRERGERFQHLFVHSILRSPYGRRVRLTGWQGLLAFYRYYYELTETLLSRWRFGLLRLNPDETGWEIARSRIYTAALSEPELRDSERAMLP